MNTKHRLLLVASTSGSFARGFRKGSPPSPRREENSMSDNPTIPRPATPSFGANAAPREKNSCTNTTGGKS